MLLGYELMGVEFGEECYCGRYSDDLFRYGLCSIAGCSCDEPCLGNSQQICGGLWAILHLPGHLLDWYVFNVYYNHKINNYCQLLKLFHY